MGGSLSESRLSLVFVIALNSPERVCIGNNRYFCSPWCVRYASLVEKPPSCILGTSHLSLPSVPYGECGWCAGIVNGMDLLSMA